MSPPIFTPDGSKVSEVILPDGATASEVVAPDGSRVFGNAIPDGDLLYEFEDDSDTSVAVDTIGSNDLDVSTTDADGITYTTTAKVGDFAVDIPEADFALSESDVDITAQGSTDGFAVFGWFRPDDLQHFGSGWGFSVDGSNQLMLRANDNIDAFLQVNDNNITATTGVSADTNAFYHIYGEATQDQARCVVHDETGAELADVTQSHSQDLTNIGGGPFSLGARSTGNGGYNGKTDDIGAAFDPLSDDAINDWVARGT